MPNIERFYRLLQRAQTKAQITDPNDIGSVLWPRLHRSLCEIAIASRSEANCLLRDVLIYGPHHTYGGEVFSHQWRCAADWLKDARRFHGRKLALERREAERAAESHSTLRVRKGAPRKQPLIPVEIPAQYAEHTEAFTLGI